MADAGQNRLAAENSFQAAGERRLKLPVNRTRLLSD
jgi:hypothetical protein